jgi:fused signal recognition particle receptor
MALWRRIKEIALADVAVLVKGVDHDMLEDIERVLIEADFGPATFDLMEDLERRLRRGDLKTEGALRAWLVAELAGMFDSDAPVPTFQLAADGPTVVLLLGVNGVGKTTVAARLARRFMQQDKKVLLAAADTFRAGAQEQLAIWGERLGLPVVTGTQGGDPAAVAFDAVEAAIAREVDVLIIDTAGRLHTQEDLVTELQKLVRVIGRRCEGAPHVSLLVIDGTVGQNAVQQGKVFSTAVPVSGLVVTKLDGTAKGGAVVSLPRMIGAPIRFVGVGEGMDDLEDFDPHRFAERLLGD